MLGASLFLLWLWENMFNEKSCDSIEWREQATQADMDRI